MRAKAQTGQHNTVGLGRLLVCAAERTAPPPAGPLAEAVNVCGQATLTVEQRRTLIADGLGRVVAGTRPYTNLPDTPPDDVAAFGLLGLLHAVEEPVADTTFGGHVDRWVRDYVVGGLSEAPAPGRRLPEGIRTRLLGLSGKRRASDATLVGWAAGRGGLSGKLEVGLRAWGLERPGRKTRPVLWDGGMSARSDLGAQTVELALSAALGRLGPWEREVIVHLYGLCAPRLGLDETAKAMGMSPARVAGLRDSAVGKLRSDGALGSSVLSEAS